MKKLQREIILDGHRIIYEIQYKQMKSCIIKFKEGRLIVSSSYMFSLEDIERFLIKNKKYILEQFQNFEAPYKIENHGYINLLGRKYTIEYIEESKTYVQGNTLYVCQKATIKHLNKFLTQLLKETIENRMNYYLPMFNLKFKPSVYYGTWSSRWGVCYPTRHQVGFNTKLLYIDMALIDYVVVHELAHFYEANHSKRFYAIIGKILPDYKERIKRLKRINI